MRNLLKWIVGIGIFGVVTGLSAYFTLVWFIGAQPEVVVPSLVGRDIVAALETLDQLGLDARVRGAEYSPEIPKNRVTYQSPDAGERIKAGREVRIRLSKGIEQLPVPDLVGLKADDAVSLLVTSGFQDGIRTGIYSQTIPKGNLVGAMPPPGKPAEAGTPVALLISLGKRPVAYKMPDVKGLATDELMAKLDSLDLRVSRIEASWNPRLPENRVASQSPLAGARVLPGDAIKIRFNRKPATDRPDRIARLDTLRFVSWRVPPSFIKQAVRVEVEAWGQSFDYLDDLLRPGTEIAMLVPASTPMKVKIFLEGRAVYAADFDPFSEKDPVLFSIDPEDPAFEPFSFDAALSTPTPQG